MSRARSPLPRTAIGLALCVAAPALAQQLGPPAGPATAQPPAAQQAAPPTRFAPFVAVEERYSDNFNLAIPETARSGWVTDLTPGLRFDYAGARLRANVDFRVHRLHYAGASELDETQRYLDARASLNAIENFLRLDANARRTQELRSQFGAAVAPDGTSSSGNRVETSLWQVSPSLFGEVRDLAAYSARYIVSEVRTQDDFVPRSRVNEWSAQLRNPSPFGRLGWSADASTLTLRNSTVGSRDNTRLRAALLVEAAPQLMLSASFGRDRTDFTGERDAQASTTGVGVAWYPSVRTQLTGEYEKRFFGRGYNAAFGHRSALTAWRLRAAHDVRVGGQLLQRSPGPAALFYDVLTTAVPDRESRAEAARRRLEESGIPALSIIDTGFLSDRPLLVRELEASAVYTGPRDTLTVAFTHSARRPLGTVTAATPLQPFELDLTESGYRAALSHRLTPLTNVTFARSTRRTEGTGVGDPRSRQRDTGISLSTQLGKQTTASIGIRRNEFDSNVATAFRENALVIGIVYRP